ncbi:MAG: ABC transporter substrate-binding protein [Pseudomonas sp.]|uniref:substrate-binding periplasmic protein n=1 Tax=Pseudomonas sp. TaxID=306 RepID=UPI0027337DED|nr:ABC transporter substrate-binding protein [Pseudomonas sp.]MDP3848157.1 ABC transporter substrate-binding protein [Pseudomonas sp.]
MRVCLLALLWGFCLPIFAAEPLRMGFGSNKPPYVFENEQRGLEYEIVVAALKSAGFQVLQPYYAPMERLHLRLERGELDGIATTQDDGGAAFYSDVYIQYQNVAVALAKRQLQINSIADLADYSVSSFQRSRFFLGAEFQAMAEHNPRYREEPWQINRNRLLYAGRIDLVIADRRIFRYFNTLVADQVDVSQPITVYPLFPVSSYQVGFRLAAQRDRFNQGLKAIRESGEYQRIEQRYADY